MIEDIGQQNEQTRTALTTLSVVGAAVAGAGIGVLLSPALRDAAWVIFAVGVVSHLVGMVGIRRILTMRGYQWPRWQSAAFWLCWAAIAVILAYAAFEVAR